MVIAIEPRVTFGAARVHYEDMFLVTPDGPKNLSGWKDMSKMMVLGQ
jgi:hypothetical protein